MTMIKTGSPGGISGNSPPASAGDTRDTSSIPGWGRPLGKEMAAHSSVLAWRTPWTEEPGGLEPMRLQRVGHD